MTHTITLLRDGERNGHHIYEITGVPLGFRVGEVYWEEGRWWAKVKCRVGLSSTLFRELADELDRLENEGEMVSTGATRASETRRRHDAG